MSVDKDTPDHRREDCRCREIANRRANMRFRQPESVSEKTENRESSVWVSGPGVNEL